MREWGDTRLREWRQSVSEAKELADRAAAEKLTVVELRPPLEGASAQGQSAEQRENAAREVRQRQGGDASGQDGKEPACPGRALRPARPCRPGPPRG